MQQQGVLHSETNGWNLGSVESRARVAAYVLSHPNEFSIATPAGNFLPSVWSHQQTHILLQPDPQQEAKDFNIYGFKTMSFEAGVSVEDEDNQGNVRCTWRYGYGVHFKEPVGGSFDNGMNGPIGGGYYPVGKADMYPLISCQSNTAWLIVELNRR